MPIYEYKCMNCGTEVEIWQKFDDPAPICENKNCTESTGSVMIKQLSNSSFVLKGSNWYRDGYSGASNKKKEG